MNISYRTDNGILSVEPTGPLSETDFETLSEELSSARTREAGLTGVLIRSKDFPGYERFSDMLAHAEFVRKQGDKVPKVALCTDSPVGKLLTTLGATFVDADVKRFSFDQQGEAERWLLN